jgi:DNA-binding transcriptional LysR family regulator
MADLRSVSFRQLRALSATVGQGSVTAAARVLGVTPPAITAQLKNLEALAGAPLFDRADGFKPTEVGRELLDTAIDIENQITRMGRRIEALRSGERGEVVFAVVSSGKYLAPNMVSSFQQRHPDVRVKLVIGNRGEIVRGLEQNSFDLIVMGTPPGSLRVADAILADHPHVLITSPADPLVRYGEVVAQHLTGARFLAREEGSGTRALMSRFLEHLGGGPFPIVEMGTNETIKQAVMARLGVAIISAHTCFSELADGKLATLRVRGLPLVRQWRLLHRADRPLSACAAQMKSFIIERRLDLFPRYQPAETMP